MTSDNPTRYYRYVAGAERSSTMVAASDRGFIEFWDLQTGLRRQRVETGLNLASQQPIAVLPDGQVCIAASLESNAVCAVDQHSGTILWRRDRFGRPFRISISYTRPFFYCPMERSKLRVMNVRTGGIEAYWPGPKWVCESPYQPVLYTEGDRGSFGQLSTVEQKLIKRIRKKTFATLAASFSPDRLVLSYSGGPVLLVSTITGEEVWTHQPPSGHFIEAFYSAAASRFFGLWWNPGGLAKLMSFSESGSPPTVVDDDIPFDIRANYDTCDSGRFLFSSTGLVWNLEEGCRRYSLPLLE